MPVKSLSRCKSAKAPTMCKKLKCNAGKKKTLTQTKNNTKMKGKNRKTRNKKGGDWSSYLFKKDLTDEERQQLKYDRARRLPGAYQHVSVTETTPKPTEIQKARAYILPFRPNDKGNYTPQQ
tara:strand:- start:342 stop:707 length:366 start_codon:yes stop_codon:yes gene_type:complete